jgi:rsbT co-antagonist protein RsbR
MKVGEDMSYAPTYSTIEEASKDVLALISRFVDVNTFFVAKNDQKNVDILQSFNRNEVVLESGFETFYRDSY